MKLLRKANEQYGQTIIMVTHDMKIAEHATRIIEFNDGKITSDRRIVAQNNQAEGASDEHRQ